MTNAYDRMMGVGDVDILSGNVDILGDPAAAVDAANPVGKYIDGKYTIQDRIDLGFAENGTVVAAGALQTFNATCASPFKPLEFVIDSTIATFLSITLIRIGASIYVEGGPVAGAIYSEVSLARKISWRTVQTQVPIQVTVRNNDVNPHAVNMTVRGFRLT